MNIKEHRKQVCHFFSMLFREAVRCLNGEMRAFPVTPKISIILEQFLLLVSFSFGSYTETGRLFFLSHRANSVFPKDGQSIVYPQLHTFPYSLLPSRALRVATVFVVVCEYICCYCK